MDNVRYEIIENMKRDLNRTDIMLDDAKCEILKDWFGMECTPNYRGEEYYYEDSWMNLASCSHTDNGIVDSSGDTCKWYDDYKEACGFYDTKEFRAKEMCCSCGGGSGSGSDAPQWEFDLDYEKADEVAYSLGAEYEKLQDQYREVFTNWGEDHTAIDEYYWKYELIPLLQKGAKLDEKAKRTLITWIADGTEVKGKPLTKVFPEVKQWMLENYNPDAPTFEEMFDMRNMML